MKYSLSSKVSKEYIQKADEIRIKYDNNEEDEIFRILEINPEVEIMLEVPEGHSIYDEDWGNFQKYHTLCKDKLVISFQELKDVSKCHTKYNIRCMFAAPIHNFENLNYAVYAGATEARICGELIHNLDLLQKFEINKRIYPSRSMVLPGINPRAGSWIRPEDIDTLEQIQYCEFDENKREREQALYRIYAEDKVWSGDLSLLVEDIETHNIMNRMIPPEFQQRRNNCGWKCITKKSNCHFCENNLFLANPKLYKEIINERSNSEG